jgi:CBS domain-containing protein
MKVSQLMHTPAVTARPSATVHEVAMLMDARKVGAVLLVDERGALCGIVTDRDLAVRVLAAGRSADIRIEDVMSREVAAVAPDYDAVEAASIMMKWAVRRLPVCDEDGMPHGLIAFDDLVRQLGHDADLLTDTLLVQAAHLP